MRWTPVIVLLLVLPIVVHDGYSITVLTIAHAQALYVASWDLVGGLAGQLSLGHALPFGAAAYAAAWMSLLGISPWLALSLAPLAGLLSGVIQGGFSARVRGPFLSVATLGIAEAAHELSEAVAINVRGAALGGEGGLPLPPLWLGGAGGRLAVYYLSLALLVIIAAMLIRIKTTRFGLRLRVVRGDEVAAEAAGVGTTEGKLAAFIVAGAIAGLAGVLQTAVVTRATPSMLSLETSFAAMSLGIAGGSGTILGPLITGYLVTVVLSYLSFPPLIRMSVYGLLLVAGLWLHPWRPWKEGHA